MILSFLGIGLGLVFLFFWWNDFKAARKATPKFSEFLRSPKMSETLYFTIIVFGSIIAVNTSDLGGVLRPYKDEVVLWASILLSGMISAVWFRYLYSLDVYEREPWRPMVITFLMACATVFLVWPMSDGLNSLGFALNGEPWNDWWYCVIGIGLVEEIVKIIPFLIILKFTKDVNEPFDYILYASICALGFAFVENSMYLYNNDLTVVMGRGIYASVAHMFDTSLIAYAMAITRFRFKKYRPYAFIVGLVLASLAHGFYDFWLINEEMSAPGVTSIFLLISIHLWTVMKNNLINLSPMFVPGKLEVGRHMTYSIINWFITVFYVGYICLFLLFDRSFANQVLLFAWGYYIYVFLFIALNFGSHEPIKGYIAVPRLDGQYLKLIVPRIFHQHSSAGEKLKLGVQHSSKRGNVSGTMTKYLPNTGLLKRRIVFEKDTNGYIMELDQPLNFTEIDNKHVLVLNLSNDEDFESLKPHTIQVFGLKHLADLEFGRIKPENAVILGYATAVGIA